MSALEQTQIGGTEVPWAADSHRKRLSQSWERSYVASLIALDAIAAGLAGGLSYFARFRDEPVQTEYVILSSLLPLLWVATVSLGRAYEARFLGVGSEEFRRILTASVWLIAFIGTFSWATKAEVARGYMIVALPLTGGLTLLGRYLWRKRLHRHRHNGLNVHRIVVLGHPEAVSDLVHHLKRERYHGLDVVAVCLPSTTENDVAIAGVPVAGTFADVEKLIEPLAIDAVAILACPEMDGAALRTLSWRLERFGTDVLVAPTLVEVAGARLAIRPVAGLPLLHVDHPELVGGRRAAKAIVDSVASASLIVALAPLLLVIGALVKLTSPGPALFRQRRIGRRGKPFTMFKFRTMVNDAEIIRHEIDDLNQHGDGPLFKAKNDPRVTRLGGWLRKYSLDELPQLFNVLIGDMSLVGPRPPLPGEVEEYEFEAYRRLAVRPGLTGLWQISGRSDLSWDESIRLDLRYVENWSLAFDALILWKTAFAVLKGKGAY